MNSTISVSDSEVRIDGLTISRKEVADYLRLISGEEREAAFIRAVEVGVFCLERASTAQDTEFVRRQIDSLLNRVEVEVSKIPDETQKALAEKIGTNDGQVLAPIKTMIETSKREVDDKISNVRHLLEAEIDPTKQTTTLGKALLMLRDLLDPTRNDSIQGRLDQAIKTISTPDGPLAEAVKKVTSETIKPLREDLDELAKEIRGQEEAQKIVEQTPLKGYEFEDQVVSSVTEWARIAGAEVNHVGTDNRPGDVVISVKSDALSTEPLVIVIEAKDRGAPVGRKQISQSISEAMNERQAKYAIWTSKTSGGFAKEIGEWAEGECNQGRWLACTFELLHVALRFAVVQQRLIALRQTQAAFDTESVVSQIQRIRISLAHIGNITRRVTEVSTSAHGIQEEAESLRNEIKESLSAIEDAIRTKVSPPTVPAQ